MVKSSKVCSLIVLALAACTSKPSGPMNDGPPPPAYPLNGIAGFEYTTNITVGGQQFDVVLDTGSTTLALAGADCSDCGVSPEYAPSSTATDTGTTSSEVYGDGSMWSGEVYADMVAITGDSPVPVKLASMSTQTGFFEAGIPKQGILGFGRAVLATPNTDSYIDNRMAAGLSQIFAVQLCPENGTLWFGGADKTHESGDEQYTPMIPITTDQPFYEITVGDMAIGNSSIGFSGPGVVDTGTSLMLLPTAMANAIYAHVTADSGYQSIFGAQPLTADPSSCVSTSHSQADVDSALPAMQVVLSDPDGKQFTISLPPSQSYIRLFGGRWCAVVSGFDQQGIPPILGDGFLRAFVTVFDLENNQIGFAPQQNCEFPTEAQQAAQRPIAPLLHGHPWHR